MNKTITLLIVGVILLAMALIMVNQYSKQPPEPPSVGTPTLTPQTASPQGTAGGSGLGMAHNAAEKPAQTSAAPSMPKAQATPEQSPPAAPARPAIPQWAANLPEQLPSRQGAMASSVVIPSPVAEARPSPIQDAAKQNQASSNAAEPAPAKPEAVKPKTEPTKVESPKAEAPKAEAPKPKPKPKGPKTIRKIAIFTADDTVIVRVDSSESPEYKTMHLKAPERLVVDLEGEWAVKAPGVPNNKFVSNVRLGKQKDSTRIVIDLKQTPSSIRYVKKGNDGLDIRLK